MRPTVLFAIFAKLNKGKLRVNATPLTPSAKTMQMLTPIVWTERRTIRKRVVPFIMRSTANAISILFRTNTATLKANDTPRARVALGKSNRQTVRIIGKRKIIQRIKTLRLQQSQKSSLGATLSTALVALSTRNGICTRLSGHESSNFCRSRAHTSSGNGCVYKVHGKEYRTFAS